MELILLICFSLNQAITCGNVDFFTIKADIPLNGSIFSGVFIFIEWLK